MVSATDSSTTLEHRLVVDGTAWERCLRSLLGGTSLCAVGAIRRHDTSTHREWLVDALELVDRWPRGQDWPPLTDRLLLVLDRDSTMAIRAILDQIEPRASQTIVILQVSLDEFGRWDGIVIHDNNRQRIEEVRVVGSGMLRLPREESAGVLETPTEGRPSRTMGALGADLWQQIRDSHVLLVGCGRNGTLAAWQLVGLGVSRLTLVDPDQLEIENLDGMPGLAMTNVGQLKATALAQKLVEFNPDLSLCCITEPVKDALRQLRSRFDLVVTCVDDDAARLAASWLSRERLIPHLDIGTTVRRDGDETGELAGDIRLLLPFEGCVSCVGGLADPEAALYELAAPPHALHRGEPTVWHQQRAGSLAHWNAITIGTAMEIWLSLLRGSVGSFWKRLVCPTGNAEIQFNSAPVSKDDSCQFCQRH